MSESLEPRTLEPDSDSHSDSDADSDSDSGRLIAEAVARGDLTPDPSRETLGAVASILRTHYAEQKALGIVHCATCHQPFPADQTNPLHGYQFCSKPCRNEYRQWAKRGPATPDTRVAR